MALDNKDPFGIGGPGTNYNNDINGWNGSSAPPNVGTKNEPSKTPTHGYNNSPPTSTALNVASTDDYTNWSWEQILNGVLGLTLPSRNQVTDLRWTLSDSNMDGDHSLFKIFGAAWGGGIVGGGKKDFLVYLNPALQDSGGPWDAFYNTPSNQLAAALSGSTYFPGVLDPRDFASAAAAVQGVQSLYAHAVGVFVVDQGLDSEGGSLFQGAAGQAFNQLTGDLATSATSIYGQMVPVQSSSYADMIGNSGSSAANFVVGLWNALVGWMNQRLDWSPLGAIFQALLDGGIVTNNGGGNYSVVNVEQNQTFGNLLTDDGWLQVEAAAKNLWNQAVNASLDEVARPLLTGLATALMNAAAITQPLQPPGMTPITPADSPNALGGNLNAPGGDPLTNLPGGTGAGPNTPAFNLGGPGAGAGAGAGLGTPVAALANPGAGLGAGAGLNTPAFNLGGPGAGAGAGAGLGTPVAALANPGAGLGAGAGLNTPAFNLGGPGAGAGAGLNTPVTALANPPALSNALGGNPNTLAAALGTTPAAASALQTALGDSQAGKKQMQKALSLAPSSGSLHNGLENALAANGRQQNALQGAVAGKTPVGEALTNALKDNKVAQTDLQHALAQAPRTGPLHNELASALADTRKTGTALHQAQTAAGIPAEMGRIGGSPAAGLGHLTSLLGNGKGLVSSVGGPSSLPAGLGGASGPGGAVHIPGGAGASGAAGVNGAGVAGAGAVNGPAGLSGGAAAAAPGQLASPQTAAGGGAGGVPFFPPMAGGGGMGANGGQGQPQERERTTWLAEDEDIWGTDPEVTPQVLGRDFADDEDELDAYEEYAEPETESRRSPSRARGR
jgi:hypothetical protein